MASQTFLIIAQLMAGPMMTNCYRGKAVSLYMIQYLTWQMFRLWIKLGWWFHEPCNKWSHRLFYCHKLLQCQHSTTDHRGIKAVKVISHAIGISTIWRSLQLYVCNELQLDISCFSVNILLGFLTGTGEIMLFFTETNLKNMGDLISSWIQTELGTWLLTWNNFKLI